MIFLCLFLRWCRIALLGCGGAFGHVREVCLLQGVFVVCNEFLLHEIPDIHRLIAVGRCLRIDGG